ncbi:MAG TPA: TMEM165/GDT1 family protein [Planctomycetota bacterium]|nr:TMEM165/GDT1 family protein [Planctomycetota bacterium]
MNWKVALTTFGLIFLAEMGDKTQLATIGLVAKSKAPWAVFLGSALALTLVALLGVLFGEVLTRYVPQEVLKKISAVSFLVIGGLMLWGKI